MQVNMEGPSTGLKYGSKDFPIEIQTESEDDEFEQWLRDEGSI